MATKIALAGAEVSKFFNCMSHMRAKTVLATYWGVRKNPDYIKQIKDKNPDTNIILDSGAFTLFTKGQGKPVGYFKAYMNRYADFLDKYGKYLYAAAELDIDNLVGHHTAQKWREDVFESIDRTTVPIIFIWHSKGQSVDVWKEYCSKYQYVGIGSDCDTQYQPLLAVARQYLTKIHAFGFTRSTELQNYDFFSCDSSTWLLGSKYGETDVFNGKTISRYDNTKKDIRRQHKAKFENVGLDWNKIASEDYYEVIKMNMLAFIEMEDFLSRANRRKAYWLKKLPTPTVVKKASIDKVDEWFIDRGWTKEDIAAVPADDRQDRMLRFSQLQHGRTQAIREFLNTTDPADLEVVFGRDIIAKISNPKAASDVEIDEMRRAYNLSLLQSGVAIERTLPEHFIPTKPPKKRPPNEEEELPKVDTESMDLFFAKDT